jgi:Putative cyclase
VLLDFRSWAEKNGISYDSFSTYRITLEQLLKCAADQGTEFKVGDILLIRSGWVEDYHRRSEEEKLALGGREDRSFAGVENSIEMTKWHWNMGFAAVAGDGSAYEAWPPSRTDPLKHALHEIFLAGWGMPIGELWNLEELAVACKRRKKWSFFLTSQPLDVPGGVASPCNAMAVL